MFAQSLLRRAFLRQRGRGLTSCKSADKPLRMDVRLVALNLGTSPEMVHRHYGHDNTKSRASEFADVWLSKEEE